MPPGLIEGFLIPLGLKQSRRLFFMLVCPGVLPIFDKSIMISRLINPTTAK